MNMHDKKTNSVFRMFYIVYYKPAPLQPHLGMNQLFPFFSKAIAGFLFLTSYPNVFSHKAKLNMLLLITINFLKVWFHG